MEIALRKVSPCSGGFGLFLAAKLLRSLRDEENVVSTAFYILGNPVRAGLVADFHDYPLCGSMEFDL
jgi:hypothetical protein